MVMSIGEVEDKVQELECYIGNHGKINSRTFNKFNDRYRYEECGYCKGFRYIKEKNYEKEEMENNMKINEWQVDKCYICDEGCYDVKALKEDECILCKKKISTKECKCEEEGGSGYGKLVVPK